MPGSIAIPLVRTAIADDSYAITFQSLRDYRRGILSRIDMIAPVAAAIEEEAAHRLVEGAADRFAQALIAEGWHNGGDNYVERLQELLQAFIKTKGG